MTHNYLTLKPQGTQHESLLHLFCTILDIRCISDISSLMHEISIKDAYSAKSCHEGNSRNAYDVVFIYGTFTQLISHRKGRLGRIFDSISWKCILQYWPFCKLNPPPTLYICHRWQELGDRWMALIYKGLVIWSFGDFWTKSKIVTNLRHCDSHMMEL